MSQVLFDIEDVQSNTEQNRASDAICRACSTVKRACAAVCGKKAGKEAEEGRITAAQERLEAENALFKAEQVRQKADKQEQHRLRKFCTIACLKGLQQGSELDPKCPNYCLHPGLGNKHALDESTLTQLTRAQLNRTFDDGCALMGKEVQTGVMFKISLLSHGYTFAAKGTIEAYVPTLRHESEVYKATHHLQGDLILVYLGSIDLNRSYCMIAGMDEIVHMMLLSWIDSGDAVENEGPSWERVTEETKLELFDAGVDRVGFWPDNNIWCTETGRRMIINLDSARYTKPDGHWFSPPDPPLDQEIINCPFEWARAMFQERKEKYGGPVFFPLSHQSLC